MLMPILRLVLIYALLIMAVVGVFNRDTLMLLAFGEKTSRMPAAEASPAPAATATAEVRPAAQPEPAKVVAPVYPPVEKTVSAETDATAAPAPAPSAPGTSGIASLQTPVATPQAAAPQPVAEALPPAVPSGELDAARRAYWTGNFDEAETLLTQLTKASPENPDLFGELGNFHFSQGHQAEAAAAFHRAGELLVEQGRAPQAMSLLAVLQQLDPEKAAQLAARTQSR